MLTSIIAAAAILGLLIVVHEAGHFLMALFDRLSAKALWHPPR